MTRFDLSKINPLTLAVLTFVVLGIAVLLGKFILPVLQTDESLVTEDAGPQLDTIPILLEQRDNFAGYKLVVPSGWNISYALASTVNTNWECLQTKQCQVLVLTQDAEGTQLRQVELSTPVGMKSLWSGSKASTRQEFSFVGDEMLATVDMYEVANAEGEAESGAELVLQVYGCNASFMCIHAGPLSTIADVNKAQMEELKSFMSQLQLQKL